MLIYDSSMKHENIEDESEDKQLYVPQFPMRKKPSINISQISSQVTQSTQMLTQYRSLSDSHEKRELEIVLLKEMMKDTTSTKLFAVKQEWINQYKLYLYQNESRPGVLDNANCTSYITVNEAIWKFFKDEYQAHPDQVVISKSSKHSEKRSRTIEPIPIRSSSQYHSFQCELPLIGMKNDSYYCYMHAGLQCLLSVVDLNNNILRYIQKVAKQTLFYKTMNTKISFIKAYYDLIEQIRNSNFAIRLDYIKVLMINQFHPKIQHDCHEFLLYLLGKMEDEITNLNKETKLNQTNFIEKIFKGKLQTQISCQNCNHKNKVIEPFLILSLAISQQKTLESCLDEYFKDEVIKDYKCVKCQSSCTKHAKIVAIPQILILHLKRFQFLPNCNKNNSIVSYPLDILNFANKTYRLRALIVHTGNLQQGHYFSFAKRFHQWFLFNDDVVKSASKKIVVGQPAYLLFYQINETV